MKSTTTALAFASLALLSGCAGEPAEIRFSRPPPLVPDKQTARLKPVVLDDKGKALDLPVVVEAKGGATLETSADGTWRCKQSGDGALVLTAGPLREEIPVRCRLAKTIQVAPSLALEVGAAPAPLQAVVLDEAGLAIEDLPVTYSGFDAAVVAVQNDQVAPVGVGETTVRASFDEASAETKVRVVRRRADEAIELVEDGSIVKPFGRGNYHVRLALDGKRTRAKLSWKGASCDEQPPRAAHDVTCRVEREATLRIEHAGGPDATGKLAVVEVP